MASTKIKMNHTPADVPTSPVTIAPLEHQRIARLAYSYREARGRPHG